jgi:hypothetical protein
VLACGVAMLALGVTPVGASAAPLASSVARPSPAAPSAPSAVSPAAVHGTGAPASPAPGPAGAAPLSTPPGPASPAGAAVVDGARQSKSLGLDGAFARRGANACTWTAGSPGIEKTYTFTAGTFRLSSFLNTLVTPPQEYVSPATSSPEFTFGWDGSELTGDSPGWSCRSGNVRIIDVGGEPALQLDITISRPTVQVTRHYVIFPRVALIREWSDFQNTDAQPHQLTEPSFLYQRLMGDHIADTDLLAMDGSYQLQTFPVTPDFSQTFVEIGTGGHMPWFAMWNRARMDGMYAGFDLFSNWGIQLGSIDGGQAGLLLRLRSVDSAIAGGASVTGPMAFTATYHTDLDDMTNRLLGWQYRYLWDFTRAPYFPAVEDEGHWNLGSSWSGDYDAQSTLQKVFNQVDHMRTIGADLMHRDNGWWANVGDWTGEDWRIAQDYLGKSGMQKIIYFPGFNADPDSQVGQAHPEWLLPGSCGYGGLLLDLTIPAAREWFQNMLISKAEQWGDFSWRHDSCPFIGEGLKAYQEEQAFRQALQDFLTARPGSGYNLVSTGANMHGYETLRFAENSSFIDGGGVPNQDGASRIFPIDKLSPAPEGWFNPAGKADIADCDASYNIQLIWNPDFYGDSANPAALECVRKVVEMYHFLASEGVVGRWVRQYHPHATDVDTNWFERLSGDQLHGLISYKALASDQPVTVYPKGLLPGHSYDVRFEFDPAVQHRTGQDLMDNGITLPPAALGEMIFLGLPNHPGAGTDHTPPSPPAKVAATLGTEMSYPGVDVTWQPGHDNNWVSYYDVLRNGTVIGKVAKGTYYFDHTPEASASALYSVVTVDGDGNRSVASSSQPDASATSTSVDDSSPSLVYSGTWDHQSAVDGPADDTLSSATGHICRTACQAFGATQGTGGWSAQNGPAPPCLQACQQFSGVQGQDNWNYQEQPQPQPNPCHLACQQFSGTQGANGWSYQTSTGGTWADIDGYSPSLDIAGDCCGGWLNALTSGTDFSGLVSHTLILGGAGHDTARAWTAPKDGVVDISAQAIPAYAGNSSVLTITRNGQPVWGPQAMDGTMAALDTSVSGVAVSAGDVIRFEVQGAASISLLNLLQWDPDALYQGDPPPPPPPPLPSFVDIATYHGSEDFSGDGPFWYDTKGYVSARLLQPSSDRDVARTWTAPADGVVDITGHVADDGLDTSGAASSVSITKNDQVIWGPQVIAAGDTSGVDAAVPGVAVSAGDVIRFQVAAGGGTMVWDPDVTCQGDPPVVSPPSAWADIATYNAGDFDGDGPYWHSSGGTVSAHYVQPTVEEAAARAWVAPADGTVDISGNAGIAVGTSGQGAVLSITKNGSVIWGPTTFTGTEAIDTSPIEVAVPAVPVRAGDVIRFEVSAPPGVSSPSVVAWDPGLAYQGTSSIVQADSVSWTFTGSQITWYTRLGRDHGKAQVLIDGKPDGRFDLFASDDINYAIPIYSRTFPAVGQHTITVQALGERIAKASGTVISVDGFQARTSSPAVVADNDAAITYTGTGWQAVDSPDAPGGTMRSTSQTGDSVSYRFRGNGFTWVGRVCSSCGAADVYIDGVYVERVDAYGYRGPDVAQAALFQKSWERNGLHRVDIVVVTPNYSSTGSEIDVDSFQIQRG